MNARSLFEIEDWILKEKPFFLKVMQIQYFASQISFFAKVMTKPNVYLPEDLSLLQIRRGQIWQIFFLKRPFVMNPYRPQKNDQFWFLKINLVDFFFGSTRTRLSNTFWFWFWENVKFFSGQF